MSQPIQITIDGRPVNVEPGRTVLEAARQLGIDIPTLCYLEKCGPLTSCLACVVNLKAAAGPDRLVPSCATIVREGMVIESETAAVREARRTAMELLLSDHVGDCLSPCQRLCPLRLPIPELIRHVQADRRDEARWLVQRTLPLPGVISRLCHAPCENGCRRGTADEAVAIRNLERSVADELAALPPPPRSMPASEKPVAIIGSGPTGLAAAFALLAKGHRCVLFDRNDRAGGTLTRVDEKTLPRAALERELQQLVAMGAEFKLNLELPQAATLAALQREFAAVLLAIGEVDKAAVAQLGLESSPTGIKAVAETCETNCPGVFAAGSSVRPVKQIVRAMSEGIAAAECIDQFLRHVSVQRRGKPFSSIMGRLDKQELDIFLRQASDAGRVSLCDATGAYTQGEARQEAARCVHCDCRAAGDCRLQHYAAEYGADAGRFREQRALFAQNRQHADVIYEPGKCIRCGICVRLTEMAREPLGLTFVGRGFDVEIAAPLNATIAEALQATARECIEGCPTGALCFEHSAAPHPSAAPALQTVQAASNLTNL